MQTQDKPSWVERLSQAEAEECLANLHRLAGELNKAMDAIVQRDLGSLHDSLYLQEVSCSRLAELQRRSVDKPGCSTGSEAACLDSDPFREIEAAKQSLLILNSRYSALLKHSGETLRLLAGLYWSYRSFARPVSGVQSSIPTWSCEL